MYFRYMLKFGSLQYCPTHRLYQYTEISKQDNFCLLVSECTSPYTNVYYSQEYTLGF